MKTIEQYLKAHKRNWFGSLGLAGMCKECGYSYMIIQTTYPIYDYTWYIMKNKGPMSSGTSTYMMVDIAVRNALKIHHDDIVDYSDPYLKFVKALHVIYGLDLGILATEFVNYGYPDIAILILRLNEMSVNNVDRFDI